MIILVINAGSSSIKYKLFEAAQRRVMASGLVEKIGESSSILTHAYMTAAGEEKKHVEEGRIADHQQGLQRIVELLMDPHTGVIGNQAEITAIGHRVVHGGDAFQATTLIDDRVIADIEACIPLAPLHNPANLMGIQVARKLFPDAAQAAVFDTAFHQSLPVEAYLYAIPFEFYEKYKIRRYGFHGTSHAFVAEETAAFLKRSLAELNLITLHLGNGASMAAIKGGRSVDTTMGMTPQALDELLNKKSGLQGLCGDNDMRQVLQRMEAGDGRAEMALAVYTYRIKTYIGAYMACLGHVDALVFTAGIGENAPVIRERSCQGLQALGIEIDTQRNRERADGVREVSAADSRMKVLVVPTNEELRIAQETRRAIGLQPEKV